MKNSLLSFGFFFFLIGAQTQAQEHPQTKVDSMLINIEKTTLTTGVLYDRVVPFARLRAFNDSTNVSQAHHFEQALQELYNASHRQKFFSYKTLRGYCAPKNSSDQVDIGVLNASFDILNYVPQDIKQGGLEIGSNGLFQKINNGKPAFLQKHVLVASPMKLYLKTTPGQAITYHFDNNFLIQNTQGNDIMKLTTDLGTVSSNYVLIQNGIILNQDISVTYTNPGWKKLSFTAYFEDGSQMTVFATLHVKMDQGSTSGNHTGLIPICADIAFEGYNFDPDETYPIKGCIEYRIYYHDGGNQLMKPVIIIDGFDPGDKRKISDADSDLPPGDHTSIEEFMVYPIEGSAEPEEIIPWLTGLGYDVVVVNQPTYVVNEGDPNERTIDGGADYIERNARAHIALYQEINDILEQNNSNEELVIVGPSMGGQISRYALAYMEAHGMDHNTRLWVSVDSPHLGANIPLGLQSLLNQAANEGNVRAIDFVDNQLGSTAAKQQLIEQYKALYYTGPLGNPIELNTISPEYLNGKTTGQGFSINRGSPYFVKYYNDLYSNGLQNSRGYPQNVDRIVAMVNGSLTGSGAYYSKWTDATDHYIGDSETGVNIRGFQEICIGPFGLPPCFDEHIASLEADFMPAYNQNSKISRFKKAFDDESKYVTNINPRGNMDNVPGGWFPSFELMVGDLDGSDPLLPGESFWQGVFWDNVIYAISDWLGAAELNVYTNEHVAAFIPTVSALGFINPDFDWSDPMDRDLTCTNDEIPFDNYYGPKVNTMHTSFSQESVTWFLEELSQDNEFPEPTVYLDSSNINGPSLVCNGGQTTYTIPNCTVSVDWWNHSSNLNVVSSDNNSITVEPINSSANGEGFVAAHFAYDYAKKEFWVGTPYVPSGASIMGGQSTVGINSSNQFSVPVIENATSYVWSISYWYAGCAGSGGLIPPGYTLPQFSTGGITLTTTSPYATVVWGNCTGLYIINCEAKNPCGKSPIAYKAVDVIDPNESDPCDELRINTNPNPVRGDVVYASILAPSPPCPPIGGDDPNYYRGQATIYDMQGNARVSQNFNTQEFTITKLGSLEPGSYILIILLENGKRGGEIIIFD